MQSRKEGIIKVCSERVQFWNPPPKICGGRVTPPDVGEELWSRFGNDHLKGDQPAFSHERTNILKPEEYREIYAEHDKVKVLSEDWNLFGIKGLETHYKKLECIRDAKRVIIIQKRIANQVDPEGTQTRSRGCSSRRGRGRGACNTAASLTYFMCGVKSLNNYNNDEDTGPYTNLLKQALNHPSLLRRMPSVNEIKPQKKKDIERILVSQFGDNWVEHPEIEWHKEVIQTASGSTDTIEIDEADECNDVDDYECLELDITEVII
ncbi:hypothetical protein EVAR_61326_1 [Eumeta japonica]|uniref:Uncharacterized protein n=1 Tax=Eumeta variegata TaxID=151549 RepID=A0A4C1XZT9_EUMVA|nr:hypothetical protein EVAR_61326_1 [Eumeta japonica]